MYIYEPDFEDPYRELEVCMNFYRDLVGRLHFWDLMEFVAYLSYRGGVDWSLKQLGRESVDQAVLAEIEELDAKLRANADYLVNELELYKHIWRDEPEEYWWWYLDGGKPDGPLEAREAVGEMCEPVEAPSVTAVAEERASYEAQSHEEQSDR
ncbi:MAG: hypothetical protein ACE5OS_07690 [Anaerolineae bacterium]